MNGKSVPFGDAQLDHITSLDNDGEDGAENWMWMEAKINQFKGSLNDKEVDFLTIKRGTLSKEDREIMENHVFHCFFNESLAKTRLKTFRQLR